MKKLTALVLVIMLNLVILGNSFAGYSEPIKTPTDIETAKALGIEMKILKDLDFDFEMFCQRDLWVENKNTGSYESACDYKHLNDGKTYKEIGKQIIEQYKIGVNIYNDIFNGKLNLTDIENKDSQFENSNGDGIDYQAISKPKYKCEFIKNSKSENIGIGCYTAFAQEGIPTDYGYRLFTMSKEKDHLVIKSKNLLQLDKVISSEKINKLNSLLVNKEGMANKELFKKVFNKLLNVITNVSMKNKNDFVNQTLKDQGLN